MSRKLDKNKEIDSPIVSVIMSAYNSEEYIGEAIRSILIQTFSKFEFIIINDGSTDGTADVIKKYIGDKRVIFIDKENTGIIDSSNLGLSIAKGCFIARMDSDDISHPTRLEKQVQYLQENPDITAVSSAVKHIGDCSHFSFPATSPSQLAFIPELVNPAIMFRSRDIEKYEIKYRKEHLYAEDCGFLYALVSRSLKLSNLSEPLLLYRVHKKSVTRKYSDIQHSSHKIILKEYVADINTSDDVNIYFKSDYFSIDDFPAKMLALISAFRKKHKVHVIAGYFLKPMIHALYSSYATLSVKERMLLLYLIIRGVCNRIADETRGKILTLKYRNFWSRNE